MKTITLICLIVFLTGCLFSNNRGKSDFYNEYADWDIRYIPLIEPVRAHSIDKGGRWTLDVSDLGGFDIVSLGVSENFVYGQMAMQDQYRIGNWFLYDVKTGLLAEYSNEAQLTKTLAYLVSR